MYKGLLSIIAVCLVMITAKLYIPQVDASVGGKNWSQLRNDNDFNMAVKDVINMDCYVEFSATQTNLYCI